MSTQPRLTVAVALEHSAANLPQILARLAPLHERGCEVLVCAADPALLSGVAVRAPALRTMACAPGARVPQMWRDALVAARAPWVALLSGHVVPGARWFDALWSLQPDREVAGIGGWFSQPADAAALDWAIYLLRYAAFSCPTDDPHANHIAADNAAYRRSAVLACTDLVARGFWEVEYHARFLAQGLRLVLDPDLEVVHVNRYTARQFAGQRREHGRAFGRDRALRVGRARALLFALASPAVPALLLAKVLARAQRRHLLGHVPWPAYGWLAWFVAHWSWGEVRGVLDALFRRGT